MKVDIGTAKSAVVPGPGMRREHRILALEHAMKLASYGHDLGEDDIVKVAKKLEAYLNDESTEEPSR